MKREGAEHDAHPAPWRAPLFARLDPAICQPPGLQPPSDQTQHARVSDSVLHKAPEPSVVSTAQAMAPGSLVDPADWFPRHDFMESRQGMMCPTTRSTTKRARQHILLIDGGQDIGDATLQDPIADARPPEWAPGVLARLRDGGPASWRWPVSLRVHSAQRCGTPGDALRREVVPSWAITPRGRVPWSVTEMRPQPWSLEMRRQTGKTARRVLPSCRCSPCESCGHDWGMPLWA